MLWPMKVYPKFIFKFKNLFSVLGLSRPMGIGITPEGYLAVSDRYNHCIRLYQYKNEQDCYDCIEMDGKCPKCRDHQVL